MSNSFEQAFALAIDDLNQDRLAEPDHYLAMVAQHRHDEFIDRLTAAMAERGPIAGVDDLSAQAHSRALAAVATVKHSAGPTGILPGALVALRKARGIDRDDILDHLAADLHIGDGGRPALRRMYHQLETGTLLGSKVSHRLLGSLARRLEAKVEDFIAAVQPTGPARQLATAAPMGRSSGPAAAGGGRPTGGAGGRYVGPDPDAELVERLFRGGPDA
jgi:hypothetical protein